MKTKPNTVREDELSSNPLQLKESIMQNTHIATKPNNKVREEFEKEYRKAYEGILSEEIIVGGIKWHWKWVKKAIQATEERTRKDVLEEAGIDLSQKCVVFIDNHTFKNEKSVICMDCGFKVSREDKEIINTKWRKSLKEVKQ